MPDVVPEFERVSNFDDLAGKEGQVVDIVLSGGLTDHPSYDVRVGILAVGKGYAGGANFIRSDDGGYGLDGGEYPEIIDDPDSVIVAEKYHALGDQIVPVAYPRRLFMESSKFATQQPNDKDAFFGGFMKQGYGVSFDKIKIGQGGDPLDKIPTSLDEGIADGHIVVGLSKELRNSDFSTFPIIDREAEEHEGIAELQRRLRLDAFGDVQAAYDSFLTERGLNRQDPSHADGLPIMHDEKVTDLPFEGAVAQKPGYNYTRKPRVPLYLRDLEYIERIYTDTSGVEPAVEDNSWPPFFETDMGEE